MKPLLLAVALFLVADLVLWESRTLHAVVAGAKGFGRAVGGWVFY